MSPSVGNQVYGFGCVPGVDQLPGIFHPNEAGNFFPGAFIGCRGLFGNRINPAMDVGVVIHVKIIHRLEYTHRLL